MFRYDYKLQLVKTADAFKPGMAYIAYLKVAHQVIHNIVPKCAKLIYPTVKYAL